jgi:hypothetical protein
MDKFHYLTMILLLFGVLSFCMGCTVATEDSSIINLTNNSKLNNTSTCSTNFKSEIDDGESCGVISAKTLLERKEISYNETSLRSCICKEKDCNASIADITTCLGELGLKTYTYKTNRDMLQTGDIIHLDFNGTGHYEFYIENNTDLTGFTGYTITTREITDQETIPIIQQRELKGQMHTMECKYWDRWEYKYVPTGRYEIKWNHKGTAFLWGRIYQREQVPIYEFKWVNHPYWACK